ncbi:glyco3, capsid size determination Sid domain protein [Klebsiella aerogenes]|nr:glyco3, capsid size determination Sid domain protein [Klebsiella aerogenes]RSV86118.1 glyco3, capsid size determination Sid domain protein [Klebsiella aerogenes]HBU8524477.1 glyco3, capsid size determination Sid domain protein [Klebsiella aerogenes]HBV9944821.1 glyco3, capsid size determination Sid domain protein [Klebsiella aerogenes]HDS5323666.1 glyco3, capsid size determination Sid domain protein [Klebsiella aerogenes]
MRALRTSSDDSGNHRWRILVLSASTLPHMNHDVAATSVQRKVWQKKMRAHEASLKARGLLS